jgi:hypothetical protein
MAPSFAATTLGTSERRWLEMRNLLIATTGFLVGMGLVIALLVALPRTTKVTVNTPSSQVAGMQHMSQAAMAVPASRQLTIRHVLKGCHVWSNGSRTGASMRFALQRGGKLSILDQDVDAHRLIQLSGPKLRLGGPMMTNHGMSVSFARKGVYRFKTRTVEMPGMEMEAETKGPDHILRLVVTVA